MKDQNGRERGVRSKRGSAFDQSAPDADATQAPFPPSGSRRPRPRTRIGLSVVLLAVAVVLGFAAWRQTFRAPAAAQGSGEADIGGPFHLTDQDGRLADQRVLLGRWSAVFFGYTYCPDTCPATLQALAAAETGLDPQQRQRFQVVFISVDPLRDTPAQMKLYLSSQAFPKGAIGLTGTPAQVADIARAYHVFYARQGTGPDYAVQHSAAIYLMNPHGQFVKPLDETQPSAALSGEIKEAMRD